jgi:hypothetical protein
VHLAIYGSHTELPSIQMIQQTMWLDNIQHQMRCSLLWETANLLSLEILLIAPGPRVLMIWVSIEKTRQGLLVGPTSSSYLVI